MKIAIAGTGYEPVLKEECIYSCLVITNCARVSQDANVIVANRMTADLDDAAAEAYHRDLFGQD